MLSINDLSVSYGPVAALSHVSLDVQRGEFVAIMGPSGTGKTTLLRLIGGALKPTRGYVKVDGQPTHELDRDGPGDQPRVARVAEVAREQDEHRADNKSTRHVQLR